MASAAVHSKVVLLLLFINCLLLLTLFVGSRIRSLFCLVVLGIISSFVIISLG